MQKIGMRLFKNKVIFKKVVSKGWCKECNILFIFCVNSCFTSLFVLHVFVNRDPNTLMLDKFQGGKLTDHGQ